MANEKTDRYCQSALNNAAQYWENSRDPLALVSAIHSSQNGKVPLPSWAIDGLLDIIAALMAGKKLNYKRIWNKALKTRGIMDRGGMLALLQLMREDETAKPKAYKELCAMLDKRFPNSNVRPGKDVLEDQMIVGELIPREDGIPYDSETVRKYDRAEVNDPTQTPDYFAIHIIEDRIKNLNGTN